MTFIFLITLFDIILLSLSQIISLHYKYYDSNRPLLELKFPEEQFTFHTRINTYHPYFVMPFKNEILPKNLGEHRIISLNDKFILYGYTTNVIFNGTEVIDFKLFVSNGELYRSDTGLSFALHYDDYSQSILHQLYNSNKIRELKFAIEDHDGIEGYFHMGGLPHEVSLPYKGIIHIENNNHWGFKLKSITINGIKYKYDIDCIVHSGLDSMFYSDELFNWFIINVFADKINKGECGIDENFYHESFLKCNEDIYNMKGEIKFELGDVVVKMKIKDLFAPQYPTMLVRNNKANEYYGHKGVFIGISFLQLFNYTVFDYENKQIELYSDLYEITVIQSNTNYTIKVSYFGNSFISIACIFLLVICKL